MMRAAIIWLVCIALTAVVVAISYRWLDMPIALWAYHHFYVPHRHFLIDLSHLRNPLIPAAVAAVTVIGLWSVNGRSPSHLQTATIVASLSVLFANTLKNELQFVFGRTRPELWIAHLPRLPPCHPNAQR